MYLSIRQRSFTKSSGILVKALVSRMAALNIQTTAWTSQIATDVAKLWRDKGVRAAFDKELLGSALAQYACRDSLFSVTHFTC